MRHIRYAALLIALAATPVAAVNPVGDGDS